MQGYVGDSWPSDYNPTAENLIRHYKAHGLDRAKRETHRGTLQPYKTYKALSTDSLIEVARVYLSEDAFAFVVGSVGYSHFEESARSDWNRVREDA